MPSTKHTSTIKRCTIDRHIVQAMTRIPRADVPDLPDRIIAATALYFNVPLISRDGKIQASDLRAVW